MTFTSRENQIFANHKNVWDKAFGLMKKNIAGDPMNEDYADFLANTMNLTKTLSLKKNIKTL